ncbi:MAG: hypothetical protein DMF66_15925 [Acidobacteria bacterium]|nr:MAG: hypothetical protein DMF66_15925 [Acidobacteriota bacterium]
MSKDSIGHSRKLTTLLARLFLTVDLALFAACARPAQPGVEGATAPTPQQAQTTTATPALSKSDEAASATPPATLEEVRGVVAHIYRDAVVVEADRAAPFVVGDFNGDGSARSRLQNTAKNNFCASGSPARVTHNTFFRLYQRIETRLTNMVVDAMLTNLHEPRSSHLLLVAAFAGREFTLEAYREVVRAQYRFDLFGDSMLIL